MPYLCTPDAPWKPGLGTPVRHSNVSELGEQESEYPGGDIVTMRCLNCSHEWQQELAQ